MISPQNGKLWPLRALRESESDRKIIKKANNKSPPCHGLQSFFAGLCKLTISQRIIAKVDILWASPPTWQRLQSTGRDTPSFSTYCKAVRSQVCTREHRIVAILDAWNLINETYLIRYSQEKQKHRGYRTTAYFAMNFNFAKTLFGSCVIHTQSVCQTEIGSVVIKCSMSTNCTKLWSFDIWWSFSSWTQRDPQV